MNQRLRKTRKKRVSPREKKKKELEKKKKASALKKKKPVPKKKKEPKIDDKWPKTNRKIVKENLEMIQRCIFYQFRKKGVTDFDRQFESDLLADVVIWLLEMDNEKLNKITHIDKHLNAFVTEIIRRNIQSAHSDFFRKYKRLLMLSTPIETIIHKEENEDSNEDENNTETD